MSTKAELQHRIDELNRELDLAGQDYDSAIDTLDKLQRRFIVVEFRLNWDLLDVALIPPSGAMSTPVTVDPLDVNHTIEMFTKVLN